MGLRVLFSIHTHRKKKKKVYIKAKKKKPFLNTATDSLWKKLSYVSSKFGTWKVTFWLDSRSHSLECAHTHTYTQHVCMQRQFLVHLPLPPTPNTHAACLYNKLPRANFYPPTRCIWCLFHYKAQKFTKFPMCSNLANELTILEHPVYAGQLLPDLSQQPAPTANFLG